MKEYDVIIIGAGIAGMTAAIYARRANKSVLVLEEKVPGGQIINTLNIENWPGDFGVSGVDLIKKIQQQVVELGAEIEIEEVLEVAEKNEQYIVKTEDDEYQAKNIIIAVGAENKKLELPNEEKLTGRGISYCATCDGAFYKNKTVAVIGGGNTALDDALYLSDLAEKVYLIHRRDEFRGDANLVEKLRAKDNVEFVLGYVLAEILGQDKVIGLKLSPSDKVTTTEEKLELTVDGVFVAIGQKPATEIFKDLVDLDNNGYIVASEDCKTSRHGIFAIGDCRTKIVRQLVTAAADGAIAINEI